MSKGILKVKVVGDASGLSQTLGDTEQRLSKFGKVGLGLAAAGATALAAGFGLVAKAGFGFNSSIEQTTISLTTMLGSQQKANDLIKEMTEFAAKTPYEFPELADASKKLIAFGFSAEDIIPTMTTLGDLAAGLNIPIGELSELYGKAKVQGRLYMEDINQLTGRGIPVIQEFAKQFGVSEGEVRKLVETGKIGFPELEKALGDLTGEGGKFGGLMEAQSKSFAGQISTMKDALNSFAGDLMKPIFGWFTETVLPAAIAKVGELQAAFAEGGVRGMLETLTEINPVLEMVSDGIATVVDYIRNEVIPPLKEALGKFVNWWDSDDGGSRIVKVWTIIKGSVGIAHDFIVDVAIPTIKEVLKRFETWWEEHGDNVATTFDGILDAAINVVDWIRANWPEISSVLTKVWNVMIVPLSLWLERLGTLFDQSAGLVNWIRAHWGEISDKVTSTYNGVAGPLTKMAAAFGTISQAVRDVVEVVSWAMGAIQDKVGGAVSGLKAKAQSAADAVLGPFKRLADQLVGHSVVPDMVEAIIDQFGKLNDKTKEKFQTMAEAIQDKFGRMSDLVKDAYEDMRSSAMSVLDRERDQINTHYDQRLADLSNFYDEKLRIVDAEAAKEIEGLNAQLDAIDAREQALQDAQAAAERAGIADPVKRAEAEAKWQEELRKRGVQAEKDAVRDQIAAVRAYATERKDTLKNAEELQIAAIKSQKDADLLAWDERKTAAQSYFDKLTTDASIAYRTLKLLGDTYTGEQKMMLEKLYAGWSGYFASMKSESGMVGSYFAGSSSAGVAQTGNVPSGTVNNNQRNITFNVSGTSGLDQGRQIAAVLATV